MKTQSKYIHFLFLQINENEIILYVVFLVWLGNLKQFHICNTTPTVMLFLALHALFCQQREHKLPANSFFLSVDIIESAKNDAGEHTSKTC